MWQIASVVNFLGINYGPIVFYFGPSPWDLHKLARRPLQGNSCSSTSLSLSSGLGVSTGSPRPRPLARQTRTSENLLKYRLNPLGDPIASCNIKQTAQTMKNTRHKFKVKRDFPETTSLCIKHGTERPFSTAPSYGFTEWSHFDTTLLVNFFNSPNSGPQPPLLLWPSLFSTIKFYGRKHRKLSVLDEIKYYHGCIIKIVVFYDFLKSGRGQIRNASRGHTGPIYRRIYIFTPIFLSYRSRR
jgi:hypothetical protein